MRRKILTYLCCAVMLLSSASVFAKKKIEPPPPQNQPPPPGLPIDGGFSYLLIVGLVYGIYAIRKRVKD